MPDKNIVVLSDNTVSELSAKVTRNGKVTFIPADTDQTLTIKFTDRVPFRNWNGESQKTGDEGDSVEGKVRELAAGQYPYEATCDPGKGESVLLVNPELIVDGGNLGPESLPRDIKTRVRSQKRKTVRVSERRVRGSVADTRKKGA